MTELQKNALRKLERYCAYQDRCYLEVEKKLAEWGLYGDQAGEILIELNRSGFLDEERFAKSFVRGHFRMKKWGRRKIEQELRNKRLSAYCIAEGFREIDDAEYETVLFQLAGAKWNSLKSGNKWEKAKKTGSYLVQKGYEPELVHAAVRKLTEV